MRDMLKHGWVYARWIPNLALGYGYPFFNYREPVPYITGDVLALTGLPIPTVLGLIYTGSLLIGAIGAGALADDLWGGLAGWIASVAYGLGPYVLLDALRRGNMPESVALAILPWVFLSIRRLILDGKRGAFIATSLLLTGLFLSHNISSLLLVPFLGVYTVLLSVMYRRRGHWPRAFLAVGLAVLMAGWFWLPALMEQNFVQLHLSRSTRNNRFHFNFVTWHEMLLAPPPAYDPDYLNPPMRISLGIGPSVLGAIGLMLALWRGRSSAKRWLAALFGCIAIGYLWMATASSVAVWEAFPLLAFVQFPWRLVGRALLPMSLLAGAVVGDDVLSAVRSVRFTSLLTLGMVVALTLLAWPRTFPPKGVCAQEPHPTIEDVYAYERAGWMGIDPESSYFPIWVERHPDSVELAESFTRGELPARMDAASLPDGGTIDEAVYWPLRASITLSTPDAFTARWLGLYFPGWRVMVDGQPVPVSPEDDSGFITFPVPAGTHDVQVWFGTTPVRTAAVILTVLGLFGWIGAVLLLHWSTQDVVESHSRLSGGDRSVRVVWLGVISGLVVLRLLLGRLGVAVPAPRVAAERLPEGVDRVAHAYDVGLDLIGTRLEASTLAADEELRVDLLWTTRETPVAEYWTSVLLVGPEGRTWSPAGTLRPRGYEPAPPTTMWQAGQYAFDPHVVSPLPGTPPGTYDVVVSLFDRHTLEPAMRIGPQGQPLGSDFILGQVEVVRPAEPFSLYELGVTAPEAQGRACSGIRLHSMMLDREESAPGDLVAVRWIWEALQMPERDHRIILTLKGRGQKVWNSWTLPPVTDWWPTDRWKAGDRWLGQHVLRLPGSVETGTYTFVAHMDGCEIPLIQVPITVQAPERRWTVPDDFVAMDILFGGRIRLAGYRTDTTDVGTGETVSISLAWQAVTALETSYRVFVHLSDAEGRIVDQSDGIPASWSRPTTGWAVDEVVVETRSVTVPPDLSPGVYTIRVGVYAEDGRRLTTTEGVDHIALDMITLSESE